jgi:polysaccharide export outer membrane protein
MLKDHNLRVPGVLLVVTLLAPVTSDARQAGQRATTKPTAAEAKSSAVEGGSAIKAPVAEAALSSDYVIGVDDLLTIRFWADQQMSGDVVVRPDGKISLPLLNDVQAAGYTPQQLADELKKAAAKYITEPAATIMIKEIRSRKVFVLGQGVARPGVVPLNTEMNVLQLLAAAGGLVEYADKGNIVIIRKENGSEKRFKFNFNDVIRGKNVQQNITLQPGDTVLVN